VFLSLIVSSEAIENVFAIADCDLSRYAHVLFRKTVAYRPCPHSATEMSHGCQFVDRDPHLTSMGVDHGGVRGDKSPPEFGVGGR